MTVAHNDNEGISASTYLYSPQFSWTAFICKVLATKPCRTLQHHCTASTAAAARGAAGKCRKVPR